MPGEPETLRVTLPSDTGLLHLISNLTRNAANAAGFPDADADKVALATDEAVTNVIQHAYHGEKGRLIELLVELSDEGIEIRVIHDGDPLDDAYMFVKDRVYVVTDLFQAIMVAQGATGLYDEDEEAEPMAVRCYKLEGDLLSAR